MGARRSMSTIAVAIGASLAVTLTGCAGTDSGGGSDASSVKIMVLGSFTKPPYVLPEIKVAAQAAVNRINADGGVGGHKVELIACDENDNPNGAAACARQAVQDRVAAVVGSFTLYGDQVVPLLEQAHIPDIMDTAISAKEGSSSVSFPVSAAGSAISAMAVGLKQQGCDKAAGLAPDVSSAHAVQQAYVLPIGAKVHIDVKDIYFSPTATDLSPTIAQASSQGISCFLFGSGGQQTVAGIVAINQTGKPAKVAVNAIALPESLLGQLGSAAGLVSGYSNFYYPSTGKPAAVQLKDDMAAVDPSAPTNDAAINAYAAVLVFAKAAASLKDITGAAVIDSLNKAGTIDVGLFAPTDFSKGGFLPSLPRLSTATFLAYTVQDGKYVPSTQEPVDVRAALAG